MTRIRLWNVAGIVAIAVVLTAAIAPVMAQYAVRGGPIYGGPFYASRGPSINVGAYAPSYYPNQPYGPAGAGFGAAYISAVPYGNNNSTFVIPATVPRNLVMPTSLPAEAVVSEPPPPPPPPTPPGPPSGPTTPPPGSISPSPGTPAVPPALAPPGGSDTAKPATPPAADATKPPTPAPATAPTTIDTTKQAKPAATAKWTHFTVKLPADARLWVNEIEATKPIGASRRFHTPVDLEPGRAYEYTFRAQWTEAGQTVTRDRIVRFKTGEDLTVDFTQAAAR